MRVLEFPAVAAMVAERADTTLGVEKAEAIGPSTDRAVITRSLAETSEARGLLERDQLPGIGGAKDIHASIEHVGRGGGIPADEMLRVLDTLIAGRRMHSHLQSKQDVAPKLWEIAASIRPQSTLESRINDTLSPEGEVKDSASAELGRLRSRLKVMHGRLLDRMRAMLSSGGLRDALQETVLTQRNGRYCLPVKSDYRGRVKGIVHDTSASGSTIFVEPEEAVGMGNELRELEAAERYEVERVLYKLSGEIGAKAPDIAGMLEALAELDFIFARGKLSLDLDCTEPHIREGASLNIRRARHPQLPRETAVPLDIDLGGTFQALLVTGPNTGGKTVLLKTVGLCVLMAQSGLHVPAAEAVLPVFPEVFADIGDEQSIQQSLSTFSSHLTNIVRILRALKPGSLALFDEIGAGTDPTEGAALAKALLIELVERGALVVCSTHYGELKAFAYNTSRFRNAAVEFDVQTLRPTYRLKMGAPGASHALTIAERLGMPKAIVERARGRLSDREQDTMRMLQRLEETQHDADRSRDEAAQLAKDLKLKRKRVEDELERAEILRRETKGKVQEQVRELLDSIRAEADAIMQQLRAAHGESKRTEGLRADLRALEQLAVGGAESLVPEEPTREADERLPKMGDRVRISGYDAVGTVIGDPKDGQVEVTMGPLRVTLPMSEMRVLEAPPTKLRPPARGSLSLQRALSVSPEIHLRHMRVDEAMELLDKYLDDAVLAGLDSVRIVHGKGTGALRQAVRERLRENGAIAAFNNADANDGGSGVTLARLKK